jgi:hypothetical protein
MSDTDEMTTELRDCLAGVSVPPPPRLYEITARGRARRRHRLLAVAGLSVAAATGATALAVNLSSASGPAQRPAANQPVGSANHRVGSTVRALPPREIRTVAFTLVRHADGSVTLTIDPTELFDPAGLQNDLEKDGIPAQVTPGKVCSSDPAPGEVSQVVVWHLRAQPGGDDSMTIDPSAMPAGSELSFGTVQLNQDVQFKADVQVAEFTLIDPNAFSCSTTPITDAPGQPDHGGVFRIGPTN